MAIKLDEHLQHFRKALEGEIARIPRPPKERALETQRRQYEELIDLEKRFRLALISSAFGYRVYEAFVRHVCEERRNILDARPYFRERQETFTAQISGLLRDRNVRGLYRFRINYRFVRFTLAWRKWGRTSDVAKLGARLIYVRDELVKINLPLAISRAKVFYDKTPKSHLSRMDLTQTFTEGMIAGVDKYVGEYSKQFRSTIVGRGSGCQIEEYSQTMLHFYPPDKRKLYRANKLVGRRVDSTDHATLASGLNAQAEAAEVEKEGSGRPYRTTPDEIALLMAAASTVSTDAKPEEDAQGEALPSRSIEAFAAPEEERPDVIAEAREMRDRLRAAILRLPLFDQKLLRLRGVAGMAL